MNIKKAIISLAIIGILIFSAIGAGNIIINKNVGYIPHQNVQYDGVTTDDIDEKTKDDGTEFKLLDDKGTIELINEGFESGATPAGWTNTGWIWDYYGGPCEGIHWDYSWAAGDTLTTPILDFQVDTELTFQNAAEKSSNPMTLEVYVDGDKVWEDVGYTHTDCEQNTVDLSMYSGDHTISFVGMTSDIYGQILDDIVVTTVEEVGDILPPQITNVNAQPNPQTVGGFVNITCDVTDDYGVDLVKVNITNPVGHSDNITMNNARYYNNTYSIIGTYYYFIWANDTSGNSNVSNVKTFNIVEVGFPSIQVEKLVWNGTAWNDSAIVYENDVVQFNVSIYNPYCEYEIHFSGLVKDVLPCNLRYVNGSSTIYEISDGDDWPNLEEVFWESNTVVWQKPPDIPPLGYLNFTYNAIAVCDCGSEYESNYLLVSPDELVNEYDPEDIIINDDGSLNVSDNANVKVICVEPGEQGLTVEKYVKWDCTPPYKKNVTADVGHWVTFKLYVNNTGDVPIDMYVRDELPSGLSYITGSTIITGWPTEEPEISGNILYWNFTNVPDGASIVITFRADVDECGEHVNLVNVTGDSECVDIYDEDTAIVWVPCEPEPEDTDLTVEKYVKWDCTPPYKKNVTADVGHWVTFKLYVNNTGDVPLDMYVRDELPSGLTYITGSTIITGISVSSDEPETSGNILYWNFTNVPDGASIKITFRADVDECGEHVNLVNVTGDCECVDIYDEDTAIVWVPCLSDLVVDKKASLDGVNWVDDTIDTFVGDIVFFMINVSNTGDQVLNGVAVTDFLPSFLTFNDDANPVNVYYNPSTNEIKWFFSHIPVGEYRVMTFSATVNDMGIDENIANVTTCGGPSAEDEVTIDASGGMHVEKLVSLDGENWVENVTVDIGDTVRFLINISYYTDDPSLFLFDFYIKDTLPCGLVYADDAYPEEPEISGQTLYWNFTGDDYFLLNGTYMTVEFNATVFCDGEMINIVNVTASECSPAILYGEDDAIVYVDPGFQTMCEKTVQAPDGSWVDEINANVGDTVKFNITTSNVGYHPVYGIVVRDILPSILTYVEDSAVIEFNGETNPYCMDYDVYDEENNSLFFDNLNVCTGVYLVPGEKISLLFDATVISEGIGINLANVTACMCSECEWQQCSDTATVNASTSGNTPPTATDPNPADGSTDIMPDDVTLKVKVIDNDGDTMDVSFYNASDDTLIKKVTGVPNGSTPSATWSDLAHDTTYTWYVIVDDSITTAQSATWSFTTEPEGMNHAPDAPYNPSPSNGATRVDRNPTLEVRVSDPDADTLTVRFYDASDDSLIGTDNNVVSGSKASVQWDGLSASTSYSWYAKVSDAEFETSSPTWSFTTESPDIDLTVEIKSGIGVNAVLKNTGDDNAENVDWDISVKSRIISSRIDKSKQGVVPLLMADGNGVSARLLFFGIGLVNVTVTVGCDDCDTVTESANGIMIGFFLIIPSQ